MSEATELFRTARELRGLEDDAAAGGVRREAEYRYEDFPRLRT